MRIEVADERSALSLLVLRILADYHYFTFSSDDLALFADLLHGRFDFHFLLTFPFRFFIVGLSFSPGYAALVEVINRHFNSNAVTRYYFNIIHSELPGDMRSYDMSIRKLDFEGRVGKCFNNGTLKLDNIILWQNNPLQSTIYKRLCFDITPL